MCAREDVFFNLGEGIVVNNILSTVNSDMLVHVYK